VITLAVLGIHDYWHGLDTLDHSDNFMSLPRIALLALLKYILAWDFYHISIALFLLLEGSLLYPLWGSGKTLSTAWG